MSYSGQSYADLPYADIPEGSGLSVPDVLLNLLNKPHLGRSWLVRAKPRDASTSTTPVTTIDMDLSTDGAKVLYSPPVQFRQAVVVPYNMSYALPGGYFGHASVSLGSVVVSDVTGSLRSLAGEDWIGREVKIYLGPLGSTDPLQYGLVADLLSTDLSFDVDTLTILVRDRSIVFDRPLQENLYLGTGGLEGSSDIKGRPKPIVIGIVAQMEPIPVDTSNLIYQVSDGGIQGIGGVEEGGKLLVFDADVADITTATPAAGEYATSLATGYIKLGSIPSLVITCTDVEGYKSPTYGFVDTISDIIKVLAVEFAGLTDPDNLDPIAFSTLIHSARMGWLFDKPTSILEAVSIFHNAARTWSQLKPNNVLSVGRITDPDAAAATFALDRSKDEIRQQPWKNDPFERVVYRVKVGYRRYFKQFTDPDFDPSVGISIREDWKKQYRFEDDTDTTLKGQTPESQEITILTALYTNTDASTLVTDTLNLRGVQRRMLKISPRVGLLERSIGDVFTLTDDRLPTSPKKFTVIGIANRSSGPTEPDNIVFDCIGGL